MLNKSKNTKISDIKYVTFKNKQTTLSWSRLRIESIQSKFKLIEFNNSKREQTNELIY